MDEYAKLQVYSEGIGRHVYADKHLLESTLNGYSASSLTDERYAVDVARFIVVWAPQLYTPTGTFSTMRSSATFSVCLRNRRPSENQGISKQATSPTWIPG